MKRTVGWSAFDFTAGRDWLHAFRTFDVAAFERLLRSRGEAFWQRAGAERALRVFHLAAERVPAYRAFLRAHRLDPRRIRTIEDFSRVPPTDKRNYVTAYPLAERCWDGRIDRGVVATSSGTTGEALYWPRGGFPDFEAALTHELIYRSLFQIHRYRTLVVIGYPMGLYVSGMATAIPSWLIAQKNYRLLVAPVGNDRMMCLRLLAGLGPEFEQVIIVGHPFFVKDVVEAARGTTWVSTGGRVRLLFCSEGFSEAWRAHVVASIERAPSLTTAINTYGASELLLVGCETPASIALRQALDRDPALRSSLAGEGTVPNLFQYNPFLRYVEVSGGEMLFTAASGIPLIRFNLHDRGRLIPYAAAGQLETTWTRQWTPWQLPFLALWGRSDHTLVFQAVNIYPQHVRQALDAGELVPRLTGKFAMRTQLTAQMDEYLEINVELTPGAADTAALRSKVARAIEGGLLRLNMEYRDAWTRLGARRMKPRVRLWPFQHEQYFRPGLKPRYIVPAGGPARPRRERRT